MAAVAGRPLGGLPSLLPRGEVASQRGGFWSFLRGSRPRASSRPPPQSRHLQKGIGGRGGK
eukprot:8691249-Alexandrium_andersonii.AAC.1